MQRAWFVVISVLLAGCAAEAPDDAAPLEEEGAPLLEATASTGVIRCVVVDEAIIPLQDVLVIVDTGRIVRTGEEGRCGFDGLEPGPHTVRATKLGYAATEVVVHVESGEVKPEMTRIVMPVDAEKTPRVVPFKHKGHIVCSTSITAACGMDAVRAQTGDSATSIINVDPGALWISTEAVWTPSNAQAATLIFEAGSGEPGPHNTCCSEAGTSPQQITLPGWTAKEAGIGEEAMFTRMFAHQTCVVDICALPGVVFQQDFEVFTHAFYNWLPDADWQFSVDGEPVPPV